MQVAGGVLRHVQHAMLRQPDMHLGRRLGLRRHLEDQLDAVDRPALHRLDDQVGRRQQGRDREAHALAEPGIDLAAHAAMQRPAELEISPAAPSECRQGRIPRPAPP
ncbi:hypothetical protein [Dankookia sp. P2]|uniref:hypothetical protein n=1 Tax=Dankookia sp. P2 TaxID=3423955 RepID=UPI003D668944